MNIWYTDNTRDEWFKNVPKFWVDEKVEDQKCLHKTCTCCDGTGVRKDGLGMCTHMISCPCPRCTPRC